MLYVLIRVGCLQLLKLQVAVMCFCVFTYYVSIYSLLYKKHGDDVFQTPRIMEGKTDSRLSGEMLLQGAETSIDNVERVSAACLSMLVDRAV